VISHSIFLTTFGVHQDGQFTGVSRIQQAKQRQLYEDEDRAQ
jgi:hypothetical protein